MELHIAIVLILQCYTLHYDEYSDMSHISAVVNLMIVFVYIMECCFFNSWIMYICFHFFDSIHYDKRDRSFPVASFCFERTADGCFCM